MRRPPSDIPRAPRPTGHGRNRARVWLIAVGALLFLFLTSLRGLAGFYTDYLWFKELHFTSVWRGVLGAKISLVVAFTVAFFVLMWANLFIADRIAPRFRAVGPEDEVVARYQDVIGPYAGRVRIGVAALFALIVGTGTSGQWSNWLLFRNAVKFGVPDPQFHQDVSLYVFKLPFLSFLVGWLFVAIVLTLLFTVVAHYFNGGIRLQGPVQRVSPQVKAHVSVLLGLLALTKAAGYYFQRFQLAFSQGGPSDGAKFTDVHARLPAIQLLMVISVAAFVLFIVNIRLRGWVLPVIAVALWGLVSIAVGVLYPAFIQRFRVDPNELSKERPYIQRNIAATRTALKLGKVEVKNFAAREDLQASDLVDNAETVRNVRLWDPAVLERTYQRLQEVRSYFRFTDVDIDRYKVDGRTTQVVLSARELNPDGLPSQSWVSRHLQYTHGYGAVLSPANAVTTDGQPDFLVKDVPPTGTPKITRPELYYGTNIGGYAIVNTDQAEIDYPTPKGSDRTTHYAGKGGVPLGSSITRAALSLRFGEVNVITSGAISGKSRAIYFRDIRERAKAAAPFLRYDYDPYPVVVGGHIKWVLDGYTISSRYPYAQHTDTARLPDGSGLRGVPFNYIRNSVKVVVDAYDGTTQFYVVDPRDPIIRTYERIFPKLFTAGKPSPELQAHFRYPEDLFRVQTNMFGRYHINDAADFYRATDAWNISQDPGSGAITGTANQQVITNAQGQAVSSQEARMDPYYLLMRLPGEQTEDFLILQPFVPYSRDDTRKELSAFMVAKSDPDNYGQLEAFVMPRDRQIDGPAIVDARIQQEPSISREVTLLNTSGSRVIQGNLLVIPVKDSLLFIRPLYVQAERTEVPEFKKAIVVYADKVVMRDSLQDALTAVFGEAPPTQEKQPAGGSTPPVTTPGGGTTSPDVAALLAQAAQAFQDADAALRSGDLAAFQTKYKQGVDLVNQAQAASGSSGSGSSTTTTTSQPSSA